MLCTLYELLCVALIIGEGVFWHSLDLNTTSHNVSYATHHEEHQGRGCFVLCVAFINIIAALTEPMLLL